MLFDEILREVGEFGRAQVVYFCILGSVVGTAGWHIVSIIFIAAPMDHWCEIEALTELTPEQQRYIAIPYTNEEKMEYSSCSMFDMNFTIFSREELENWDRAAMVTNVTRTRKCDWWMYDQSVYISSVVSQWDLVCNRAALLSLVQTMFFIGYLIGSPIFGQLSDRLGRRTTLMIILCTWALVGIANVFMWNYGAYLFVHLLLGACTAGAYTTAFVITMEIIGSKYRMVAGTLVSVWSAIGGLVSVGIEYAIPNHIIYQAIMTTVVIILSIICWIIPESPRWLVTVDRDEEAEHILRKIARYNGNTLPMKLNLEDNRTENTKVSPTVLDLFKYPRVRTLILNMWYCWFATALAFFGLALGINMLEGSIFLLAVLSGVSEIAGYVTSMVLLHCIGRRWPTIATFGLTAVFCFLCAALIGIPGKETALTASLMTGKFFISIIFAVLYVYAAELLPTTVRNVGLGTSSMWARLGAIFQPLLANLNAWWPPAQFIIYGIICGLAVFSSLVFPETKDRKLPETLEEVQNNNTSIEEIDDTESNGYNENERLINSLSLEYSSINSMDKESGEVKIHPDKNTSTV